MEALKHLSSMSFRLNWACGLANLFGKNRNAPNHKSITAQNKNKRRKNKKTSNNSKRKNR